VPPVEARATITHQAVDEHRHLKRNVATAETVNLQRRYLVRSNPEDRWPTEHGTITGTLWAPERRQRASFHAISLASERTCRRGGAGLSSAEVRGRMRGSRA
jgi:hypothetical protein